MTNPTRIRARAAAMQRAAKYMSEDAEKCTAYLDREMSTALATQFAEDAKRQYRKADAMQAAQAPARKKASDNPSADTYRGD